MDDQYGATAQPSPAPVQTSSDSGLSGLGLIMQLVGGIMTAIVGCYGMLAVIAILQAGGRGAPGTVILWLVAVLGTSLARSVTHAAAGRRLLYDGPGTPGSALKRYLTLSAVQVAVVAIGMLANDAPGGMMLALVLVLGAWPAALLFIAKPKVDAYGDQVPMADDKGFDGAAILLLIFGKIGLGISAVMLIGSLEMPDRMPGLIKFGSLVAFGALTVRSAFHLRAGIRGTKATHMAETAEAAMKYANVGTIASVIAGGVFLVVMVQAMGSAGPGAGGAMFLMLIMVVMITWVLLVWPLTVKRFFGDRQFASYVTEQGASLQQSSDRGLPTLGWLLLAIGAYALSTGLAAVLMGDMFGDDRAMRRMSRGGNPLGELMGIFGNVGGKSPWFGIVTAALQIWAGVELIRMSPRYKIAGMVFGGVASAIALYVWLPVLGNLMDGGASMIGNPLASIMFVSVAMALVVPISTLVFVQRKVRDPKALAKTFE